MTPPVRGRAALPSRRGNCECESDQGRLHSVYPLPNRSLSQANSASGQSYESARTWNLAGPQARIHAGSVLLRPFAENYHGKRRIV
jgi:hypothetical protein